MNDRPLNIAVIGSGVAGLTATHILQRKHRVTLFEKEDRLGGHTNTVTILDGPDAGTPVDTGFIMQHLDEVDDIVFSQPMSTAEEVAQAILDLCGNQVREQDMPVSSGILATAAYLMPWIARFIRPTLERKGARVKARLKAEHKRAPAE